MNTVAIYGGLGNQMFQYALAIAMDADGIPTRISVNDYLVNQHYQGFELLKAFNVPIPLKYRLRISLVNRFRPAFVGISNTYIKNILSKLLISNSNIYREEKEFSFDKKVFEQQNAYFIGTWQSLKYFESQEKLIKEVFNFKKPSDQLNHKFVREISNCNSVAVHVRRGDFTKAQLSDSRMLFDSLSYYHEAFEIINESIENPVFYIFSDDIQWAKDNFIGYNFVFVSHNTGCNSYLDMYLMSICKHFVITNSSFSWWAAWLADSTAKKVIMPRLWVNNMDSSSIFPKDWIVLDVNAIKYSLT